MSNKPFNTPEQLTNMNKNTKFPFSQPITSQAHKTRSLSKAIILLLIGISIVSTGSWFYWQSQKTASQVSAQPEVTNKGGRRNAPLAPVRTAIVNQQDMPYIITALGTITPKQHIILTSRVNGELLIEHFTEGQYIHQGDLLFTLDRQSYEIAVAQAQGQLIKDEANLANAKADVLRFQNLTAQRAISDQELVTQKALVKQLEGVLKSSQAALDNAELQLSYTEIKAPISGKLGLKQSSIGNYIQANNTPLISITQTSPIDVRFAIPESQITPLTDAAQNALDHNLTVEVWDRSHKNMLATGKLLSFDNQIDTTTGTLALKAELANDKSTLFPNQFVNIRLHLNTLKNAYVIPINALQLGADGEFVWRVIPKQQKTTSTEQTNTQNTTQNEKTARGNRADKNQTSNSTNASQWQVEKVNVKTSIRNEQFIVIESGLNVGDKIVTDGVDRLSEGTAVEIVETSNSFNSNPANQKTANSATHSMPKENKPNIETENSSKTNNAEKSDSTASNVQTGTKGD